jgi:hypothetical protein
MAAQELPFEIVLGATRDRATAETPEAALLAAATLVDDAYKGTQGQIRELRGTVYITENGAYAGVLTAFARQGTRTL